MAADHHQPYSARPDKEKNDTQALGNSKLKMPFAQGTNPEAGMEMRLSKTGCQLDAPLFYLEQFFIRAPPGPAFPTGPDFNREAL